MIDAVALGPKGSAFSVSREKGVSAVVANTRDGAVSLYQTPDKLQGLWVSPAGNIHAVGKRHHTGASHGGGEWRSEKLAEPGFSIWGASDDDFFVGGDDGAIMRCREGKWSELGNAGGMVTGICGSSSTSVWLVGYFENTLWFDGATLHQRRSPCPGFAQGVWCSPTNDLVWICATDAVFLIEGGAPPRGIAKFTDEIYGIGLGKRGLFVQGAAEAFFVDGTTPRVVKDNADKAFSITNGSYATCMIGNGKRVVAGGARSVLVEDGDGFVVWPALDAPKASPRAAPKAKAPPKAKKKPARSR